MYFERIASSGPSIKKFENEEAFNTYLENHPNTPAGTQFLIKDSNTVLYYNGTDAKTMTDVMVFDTKDDLDAYIADTTNTLNEGLIFLIKQAGASPYWWNGSELVAFKTNLENFSTSDDVNTAIANATEDMATKTGVETLENKTLTNAKFTNNQFKTADGTYTITIPTGKTTTLATTNSTEILYNKTLSTAKFYNSRFYHYTTGNTITIPDAGKATTMVLAAGAQTVLDKKLSGAKFLDNQFKTADDSYTITIPSTADATLATTDDITTATDDMATKTGVEILTNKTLSNVKFGSNQFKTTSGYTLMFPNSTTDTLVGVATTQTLINKTLTGVKFTSNQFKTTGNYVITIPNTGNATLATTDDLPAISSTDHYPTIETNVIDKSTSFIKCTTVVMGAMKLVYIKATLNTALISSSDDTHIDLTLFPAGTFPAPKEDVQLHRSLAPTVAVINTVDLKADGSVYVAGYASSSETANVVCSTFYVIDA